MNETYLSDNSGNRVAPLNCADPVAASGITLATGTAGDDKTQTLVQGQLYVITFVATAGKVLLMSATGVTSTAANIEWVVPAGFDRIFRMPLGKTTLYYEGDENTKNAYIRKLAEPA